jgi:hypothetical protein
VSGGTTTYGLIANDGRGYVCFFAHSRATGVPILDELGTFRSTPDVLRRTILAAPRRKLGHDELEQLDPLELQGDAEQQRRAALSQLRDDLRGVVETLSHTDGFVVHPPSRRMLVDAVLDALHAPETAWATQALGRLSRPR